MAEPEAGALWKRFSAWMEEHAGDLAGFAQAEGFTSIHPELHSGEPVLVASRTAQQMPYASAATKRGRPSTAQPARKRPGRRR